MKYIIGVTFAIGLFFGISQMNSIEAVTEKSEHEHHAAHDHHGDHGHHHHHNQLDVSDMESKPNISMIVEKDDMSGWNIQLTTENFTFAPERVNESQNPAEGHAHLYVNETKLARLYGNWYHLGPQTPGEHQIRVTLNTNDHADLIVDGKPIEAVAMIVE